MKNYSRWLLATEWRQGHCRAFFLAIAMVASCLLLVSVLSTSIDSVEQGLLSMSRQLPVTYWSGFTLLAIATWLWYSTKTEKIHFVLFFLWLGYLFLGPELMEAHPRSPTSYGHAWGVSHVREGLGRMYGYFPYLGLHYGFAALGEVIDVSYFSLMRIGTFLLYSALSVGLFLFLSRALDTRRSVLLASLATLAMLSLTGVTFNPASLGLTLILFLLYVLARPGKLSATDRVVLVVLYSGLVVTHGLSSLMAIYLTVLASFWAGHPAKRPDRDRLSFSVLSIAVFSFWLLYSSASLFKMAVTALQENVVRTRFAFSSAVYQVSPFRPGREEITLLTIAFLLVLFLWLVSNVASREFWSGLSAEKLWPLFTVAGMPLIVGGTGNFTYEGLVRVYVYGVPFLAWFLARESSTRRSSLVFLLVLLSFGSVLLYAREFEELPPSTQIAGSNFVSRAANADATILQGECLPIGAVTNIVEGFSTTCLAMPANLPRTVPDLSNFTFAVLSKPGQAVVSFLLGEERWNRFRSAVVASGLGKVYSNGEYDVFGSP